MHGLNIPQKYSFQFWKTLYKELDKSANNEKKNILQILQFHKNGLESRAFQEPHSIYFYAQEICEIQIQLEIIKRNQHFKDYERILYNNSLGFFVVVVN